MRIGLGVGLGGNTATLAGFIDEIARAEALGFPQAWVPQIVGRGYDALTLLALAGQRARRIALGTAVVPTYPVHPTTLAQQALTVQAATGGRLTLGIGLSHRVTMEERLGLDWSRPIRHLREYLGILLPALRGEPVTVRGEEYRVTDYRLALPDAAPPPVLIAALGPQMLRLAGRRADGTVVWMGGPRYLARECVPTIAEAARVAGRPAPRVVAGLPVCVTDRVREARQFAAKLFERYGWLPSYRAILDKDGAKGPEDVALIGPEEHVRAGLRALADAGVTDFNASIFSLPDEDGERTLALLADEARQARQAPPGVASA